MTVKPHFRPASDFSHQVFRHFDPTAFTILRTDTIAHDTCAVLLRRNQAAEEQVGPYASVILFPAEGYFDITEEECLAIV